MCLFGGGDDSPPPQQLAKPTKTTRTQEDTARDREKELRDKQIRNQKTLKQTGSLLANDNDDGTGTLLANTKPANPNVGYG